MYMLQGQSVVFKILESKVLKMLNRILSIDNSRPNLRQYSRNNNIKNSYSTNSIQKVSNTNVTADKLANAYQSYNNIKLASTISFSASLKEAFDTLNQSMFTCQDENKKGGEVVGSRVNVSDLISRFSDDLPNYDDAIKTTIPLGGSDKDHVYDARTQLKKGKNGHMIFEMIKRSERKKTELPKRMDGYLELLNFETEPNKFVRDTDNPGLVISTGTPETVYVLNTKNNLMAVVENQDNVLLTNAGTIEKRNQEDGYLKVNAKENIAPDKENEFRAFTIENVPKVTPKSGGTKGGGTEIVIGLEQGRFVPEIIDSIRTFVDKVQNDEIVLDEFTPAQNAKNMQLSMLAGGFGSRAEYTNASSSKIMHGNPKGSNLTKGCFRTATGLTPMETTFISLHNAGLLDCSKENLGIGKNIKFYINDSGNNGGNGGFTLDMYNTMERNNRDSLLILPNDAMSRMPVALKKVNDKMNTGDAAVVMIAKTVDKEDARGKLGIMKINDKGIIEAFAEKPKTFDEGYLDAEGKKCFANTFQFAVSKEAFKALSIVEPYLPGNGKEPKDWSKTFTPILMALTQKKDTEGAKKQIEKKLKLDIPTDVVQQAKDVLGNQKIYAVKTEESWADCGTLNALYHTTMQIASGDFKLEDFERKHVLDSINTKTGLVTSNPEQKSEIEKTYKIEGQVMAVPKAKVVAPDVIWDFDSAITRYSDKN